MRNLILLFCLMSLNSARAGILLEPIVGYTMGDYKSTAVLTGAEENARIDGFTYGGRLGWNLGGLFIGGEYQAARAQYKVDGTDEATNWANKTIFGELGYEFFFGLRVFAGMSVRPHESELSTTPEHTLYTGTAKKVGIGYHYRVPFALNAEYVLYDLNKYSKGETEGQTKDLYDKLSYGAVIVSVSCPFGF